MVTKVKCVNPDCELRDQAFPVTALLFAKVAALDGPYPCPKCSQKMKVAARVLASYKPGAGAKTSPRRAVSRPAAKKTVVKNKFKGIKVKMSNAVLGGRKLAKKPTTKTAGLRKRGPSK